MPALPLPSTDDGAPPSEAAGGGQLARNTVLNVLGQGAPLLVAVVAIPLLIDGLGAERFGMLTIAWVVLGYFSLFDLGIGRAVTQLLSEKLGADKAEEIPALLWTALLLTLGLGLAGGAVTALLAPWIVRDVVTMPPAIQEDSLHAFLLLAAAVPIVISTASLRGILEARQRFGIISALRLLMGVFTFAGPLLVLPFSRTLYPVVLVLLLGRAAAWGAHAWFCLRFEPGLRAPLAFEPGLVRLLLRFGGWMTVSNVVSPLMVYMDRFLIGALVSATAVAYYATPWEVVTKLLIIPSALAAVLFPAFGFWRGRDRPRVARLYRSGIKFVTLALFPPALLVVAFARPGLLLWVGEAFAENGFRPMQLLAIGVLLNAVASLPFALVQGLGRADLTARLHLIELPFYVVALWGLLHAYGLAGAALAWLLRVALDLALLFLAGQRLLPMGSAEMRRTLSGVALAVALLLLLMAPAALGLRAALVALSLAGYGVFGWKIYLTADERAFLLNHTSKYRRWGWGN